MSTERAKQKVEFGDFQTPLGLAHEACRLLARLDLSPSSILEPTCGRGAFLGAALRAFPGVAAVRGFDCNPDHVQVSLVAVSDHPDARVECGDFFKVNWDGVLSELPDPILVVGNPPWVTNAAVGSLAGANLPPKANIDGLRGIDALTGRSNFDISEWMLRETMRWLQGRVGAMAVLCKTAVARKLLHSSWSNGAQIESAAVYRINAIQEFGASVDACFLVVRLKPGSRSTECEVYETLRSTTPSSRFGLREHRLVANLEAYRRLSFLYCDGLIGWRSGIKHDCSRVFELSRQQGALINGLGEHVSIETDVVFPLLKSSDIVHGREPRRFLLIPQRSMEESPLDLERRAPLARRYLVSHSDILNKRGSSIYTKRPPFSIFGIGPYSLTAWKVAISGLYKELRFSKVGPYDGRPIVFDDTCYLFPCDSEEECDVLYKLVTSSLATEFWCSLVFWDSKRPITATLLNVLDLAALARKLDRWTPIARRLAERQFIRYSKQGHQTMLFPAPSVGYHGT
ncbi:MAG: SAM-dependent DNA methyltransferase [Phycisphaerae bacterium]